MKQFHLYYWGDGLEKWIEFFSTDSLDELITRFQSEARMNPHLKLKSTEETELRIDPFE
jgi:hypothetical protein